MFASESIRLEVLLLIHVSRKHSLEVIVIISRMHSIVLHTELGGPKSQESEC